MAPPVALLGHVGQDGVSAVHRSVETDADDLVPLVGFGVGERLALPDASVVYEAVDATERVVDGLDHLGGGVVR